MICTVVLSLLSNPFYVYSLSNYKNCVYVKDIWTFFFLEINFQTELQ